MIADEFFPAYYRPALKDYLAGRVDEEKLWARPSSFYQQHNLRFVPGHAVGIQPVQQYVQLHDGQRIPYDKLLLANGARARPLNCPGQNLGGVTTLRTIGDYQQILKSLPNTRRVVICGSGTLALESAEALRHQGLEITHLLRYKTIWPEILDATASDLVLQEERRDGIEVFTEEEIASIAGTNGQVKEVLTTRGRHLPCDLVLIAIGIEPLLSLVQNSGIACGRGIKVDASMRTNVHNIFAAGDVVETLDPLTNKARVIGQWYPAIQQAQIAARSMLEKGPLQPAKNLALRTDIFYNATFLYGLDFVSLGQTNETIPGCQKLVADPQPQVYRKLIIQQGRPIGGLFLGDRKQAFAYKRAIDHRVDLSPVLGRLFRDDFDLDRWLDQQQVPLAITDMIGTGPRPAQRAPSMPLSIPPGSAKLVQVAHPAVSLSLQEQPLPLVEQTAFTIGRHQGAHAFIDHSSVSRHHAEIMYTHGRYRIHDKGSSNGTFINSRKLSTRDIYTLEPDDQVRFGDVQFRFQSPSGSQATGKSEIVAGLTHRNNVRPLSPKQVQFEIDMCIGCDRCMSACPVPLSSLVSIAALNQATISNEVSPNVARFTEECILCGSCVPVCPVDNHRDLLMTSLKQRLGSAWDKPVNQAQLKQKLPRGLSIPDLIQVLRAQRLLRDPRLVSDQYLLHLTQTSQMLEYPPGTSVFNEGEYGRDIFLILSGTLVLSTTDHNKTEVPLAILKPGEFTGEYGMQTGQPYNTSARANSSAVLLRVPEQVMQRLLELVPALNNAFTDLSANQSLKSILKRLPLFQGVGDEALKYLIEQTQIKQYDRDAPLFTEEAVGRPSRETVHIILEGFVKVARHRFVASTPGQAGDRIIAYRQSGDYFVGGLDLLGDSRAVTATTINRTRIAEVPFFAIKSLFQRYPEVEQRFKARLQEYRTSTIAAHTNSMPNLLDAPPAPADKGRQAGLHSLVKDGVVEGTEVLVIDLDTCMHCNECEEACGRRHGQSRMNRNGIVLGNITVVTACRQCQDPVCMLCSRSGIARLPNGEVYITDSCIGCGICAERCPYDAISIVNVEDKTTSAQEDFSTLKRFGDFFRKGIVTERQRTKVPVLNGLTSPSAPVAPGPLDLPQMNSGFEQLRKKIAIKCDLCAGYNDQACVQACPVGAAFRVQPTTFFGTTEEILKR
jgi:Fe-S-cluster-containing hydrogenase component 2/CRP-like cAMP-binding protein/thioredoxin reductase